MSGAAATDPDRPETDTRMNAPIVFHFDFSSPYGYIGSQKIGALAARHGRSGDWRPMLLGAAFKVAATAPLTSVLLKGDDSKRDISDPATAADVARGAGIDAAVARAAIGDPSVKDALKRDIDVDAAIGAGVFGSPLRRRWRAVPGENRLEQIDRWLERGGF